MNRFARRPNFMIIGAPKCGTTTVSQWLASHPDAFITDPKEPFYFCSDIRHPRRFTNEAEYFSLFEKAPAETAVLGEASTLYMFSRTAIRRVEETMGGMRYVVLVRDPLEMCISWHNHLLRADYELEKDLVAAIHLEPSRRQGTQVPPLCPDPVLLQYRTICDLGTQLQRLRSLVHGERVLVLRLDRLISSPEECLHKLLDFLGLEQGCLSKDFGRANQATRPRLLLIDRLLRPIGRIRKRWFPGLKGLGLLNAASSLNQTPGRSTEPGQYDRGRLEVLFEGHRKRLEESLLSW